MSVVIHDFVANLERSHDLSDEPAWVEFYRGFWPDLLAAIKLPKNNVWQRHGVDRKITLPNGRDITVDEKKREKDYGDLLIEEWSVGHICHGEYVPQKVGWSLDRMKWCDYVAYAVPCARKCYLLPFELLRTTCEQNLDRWKTLRIGTGNGVAYPKDAHNRDYVTRNCAVEWPELRDCLCREMVRRFGTLAELPVSTQWSNEEQLIFEWGKKGEKSA